MRPSIGSLVEYDGCPALIQSHQPQPNGSVKLNLCVYTLHGPQMFLNVSEGQDDNQWRRADPARWA